MAKNNTLEPARSAPTAAELDREQERIDELAELLLKALNSRSSSAVERPRRFSLPRRHPKRRDDVVTDVLDTLEFCLETATLPFVYRDHRGHEVVINADSREGADREASRRRGGKRPTLEFVRVDDATLAPLLEFHTLLDEGSLARFVAAASRGVECQTDTDAMAEALALDLKAARKHAGWEIAFGSFDSGRSRAIYSWIQVDVWVLQMAGCSPMFFDWPYFRTLDPTEVQAFPLSALKTWRAAVRQARRAHESHAGTKERK